MPIGGLTKDCFDFCAVKCGICLQAGILLKFRQGLPQTHTASAGAGVKHTSKGVQCSPLQLLLLLLAAPGPVPPAWVPHRLLLPPVAPVGHSRVVPTAFSAPAAQPQMNPGPEATDTQTRRSSPESDTAREAAAVMQSIQSLVVGVEDFCKDSTETDIICGTSPRQVSFCWLKLE